MDNAKLAKMINSSNVEAVAIPSTASRPERDRLVREFAKKAERVHDGEVVLVIVKT
jgi:Trm5-related predicted tRNA methylase